MTDIDVACDARPGGWDCRVRLRDGHGTTDHDVAVDAAVASRIVPSPASADIERLVRETFTFLLEREPKESILRRFDLSVVERYFPEYPGEIRRRLPR